MILTLIHNSHFFFRAATQKIVIRIYFVIHGSSVTRHNVIDVAVPKGSNWASVITITNVTAGSNYRSFAIVVVLVR